MKALIRVPTKTQYAFIEATVEGTAQEIVGDYNELSEAYWGQKNGEGLPKKEFDEVLDDYCWNDGSMHSEQYAKMNKEQQDLIQAIKRSKKRALYQSRKEDIQEVDRIRSIR